MNISLIANTGIQFFSSDFEIKPEESFVDRNGNFLSPLTIKDENDFDVPLVFHESYDFKEDVWTLEMAVDFAGGRIVRLDDLRRHKPSYLYLDADENERLVDESKIDFSALDVLDEKDCYRHELPTGNIAVEKSISQGLD